MAFNDRTNVRVKGRFDAMKRYQAPLAHSRDSKPDYSCARADKAPPGFEGTVKAMKAHPEIDNPWALAWYMADRGDKPHK